MNNLYDNKPIIACSSGLDSNAAIALIRISGFAHLRDIDQFFSLDLQKVVPKKVFRSNIVDGDLVLDNCVLVFYQAPNSYNGENILELSVHGNLLNVRKILKLFLKSGTCRMAREGEFTYRAFLNKKLSLPQVEGLDLFLNASSSLMLSQGLASLQGELYQSYQDLLELFIRLKASVELSIDFLDDVGEGEARNNFDGCLGKFIKLLSSLHLRTQGDFSSLISPSVVIVGQTNAGKSTLFNRLLQSNRSIVSQTPGTTRDYVSEFVCLNDTNFKLIDTAGLRDASEEVEKEGINRTLSLIKNAFFKILVVNPFQTNETFFSGINDTEFDLVVFTHADVDNHESECLKIAELPAYKGHLRVSLVGGPIGPKGLEVRSGPIGPSFTEDESEKSGPIGPSFIDDKSEESGPIGPLAINANVPPDSLFEERYDDFGPIFSLIEGKYQELIADNPIIIERHRETIKSVYSKTVRFSRLVQEMNDAGIISSELNLIGNDVNELVGIVTFDQVISSIFSNFCIGK